MRAADASVKQFLYPHMYRHPELMRVRRQADDVLRDLFGRFVAEPSEMPEEWRANLDPADMPKLARRVADYIAGMTDRFALLEHQRLFDVTPDLR
jgi:dGTPase